MAGNTAKLSILKEFEMSQITFEKLEDAMTDDTATISAGIS